MRRKRVGKKIYERRPLKVISFKVDEEVYIKLKRTRRSFRSMFEKYAVEISGIPNENIEEIFEIRHLFKEI